MPDVRTGAAGRGSILHHVRPAGCGDACGRCWTAAGGGAPEYRPQPDGHLDGDRCGGGGRRDGALLVLRPSNAETGPVLTAPGPPAPAQIVPEDTSPVIPATRVITESDLLQQVAVDRSVTEALVGSWVPQLSSKRLGLTVRGVTFGYPEILADFQALRTGGSSRPR